MLARGSVPGGWRRRPQSGRFSLAAPERENYEGAAIAKGNGNEARALRATPATWLGRSLALPGASSHQLISLKKGVFLTGPTTPEGPRT